MKRLAIIAFILTGCVHQAPPPPPDPMAPGFDAALRYAIWILQQPVGPKL